VLTHLAAEAALAPWAEGVEVLVVGFDAELAGRLEQLAPDRVTAMDDLNPSMLRVLGTRASRVAPAGDRLASRIRASGPDAQSEVRPPLLVVCAAPPEELPVLAPGEGRAGIVVIARAPWTSARATWVLGGPLPVPGQAPVPVPCQLDAERALSLTESLRIARRAGPVKVVSERGLAAATQWSARTRSRTCARATAAPSHQDDRSDACVRVSAGARRATLSFVSERV